MRQVLRRADFRLLFCGLIASMAAESILVLALAIWVKDITGSSGQAGMIIFAVVAPMLLAPLVGWFVDRFRRRPFLVGANLAVAAALIPLFAVRERADAWIIYVVAVLYGLSYLAVSAALAGLVKVVVPDELLAEANGALQTVRQGLRLGGPIAGAALYTAVGGWTVAAVTIAGFVLSALAIAVIRVREDAPEPSAPHWLREAGAGLRHVAAHPVLRRVTTGMVVSIFMLGFNETLVFAYVDQGLHRQPGFVGVLSAVQGVGGLLGGALAAPLIRRLGEVRAVALGMLALTPASLSFVVPHLWLSVPGMVFFGCGLSVTVVSFHTLLQRATPAAMMGRVAAGVDALISGPSAVAIAAGAGLVSVLDYRVLFVGTGAALLASGWSVWRSRLPGPVHREVTGDGQPAVAAPHS
ncbi:MFS transporter [Catellatospora sp. KI3]|uniref:MFS transporter n=1 Tax=Catellatospora sp. KI3 TaxID=3041620 RepID=UPI002482CCFD|nr:MFS transporter [Catellatospora sp. KI3]MDI1462726.1 MFS transporter [Catellatospora sp. KI3]